MKAEIYQTPAHLNSGFQRVTKSLKKLESEEVMSDRYVHKHSVDLAETSATINIQVLTKLNAHEDGRQRSFQKNADYR